MGSPSNSRGAANSGSNETNLTRRDLLALTAAGLVAGAPGLARAAAPAGQLTWAIHVSLAPTWFDPAETQGIITPYMVLYALHDAMVKPMPDKTQAPCLAESWSASSDGLSYEFVLRKGVKFHNGEPVTAEDVKFSFERYHGVSHDLMKENVAAVETPDPQRVRFKLKKPWPDFLTFYSTATGSGWIVPKKYVEQVGDEGFKKAPIGAGPYKFVSFNPGVELVLEAFDGYWRKTPSVKRLVMKVIPDEATRLAALKRGEVDIAYSIRSELAEELRRTPELTLKPVVLQAPNWLYFPEQWDPKSPWHDVRVRQAANLAIDRQGMSEALFLGYCKITNSIVPYTFDYYWQPPAAVYDPAKAKKLLAEAGHPERVRRRAYVLRQLLREHGRGVGQQSRADRHPNPAAADRTGRVLRRLHRQEIHPWNHPGRERGFRQRRDKASSVRRQGRRLRLWQLSRHRRALPAASGRAGSRKARRRPREDAAARSREGDLCANLAARLSERGRPAGG